MCKKHCMLYPGLVSWRQKDSDVKCMAGFWWCPGKHYECIMQCSIPYSETLYVLMGPSVLSQQQNTICNLSKDTHSILTHTQTANHHTEPHCETQQVVPFPDYVLFTIKSSCTNTSEVWIIINAFVKVSTFSWFS